MEAPRNVCLIIMIYFNAQDEIEKFIIDNSLIPDYTISGINIDNIFYKINNIIILKIHNKTIKDTSFYFIFDEDIYDPVLKQDRCWSVSIKNKPFLVLKEYDKITKKTKTFFFSKILGDYLYPYNKNEYQYIIDFSTTNFFDYRNFNIRLIPQKKTINLISESDLTFEKYIVDFKKRYPNSLRMLDKQFVKNGILKANYYYKIDNDLTIMIVIIYKPDNIHIREYKELFIDTIMASTLRKRRWTIINQRLHNSIFTNIVSIASTKKGNLEKIALGRYILKYNKQIFNNDIGGVQFKNNNKNDFRLDNLIFKRSIKNVNKELNQNIIEANKNHFQYRFIFNDLSEIPPYWRKIHENYFNKFYLIEDDIVAAVTKIKFFHVKNKHVTTIIDLDTFKKIKKLNAGCIPFRDTRRPEHMVYINLYFDKTHKTRLHRFVVGETDPEIFIDHINRDTLDNRRVNLRRSTVRFNNRNLSVRKNTPCGVLGVKFCKDINRWKSKRTMKDYLNGTNEIKYRSVLSNDFETAVINRKKLELISDEDFLSNKTTWVLLNEYKEDGKYENIYF